MTPRQRRAAIIIIGIALAVLTAPAWPVRPAAAGDSDSYTIKLDPKEKKAVKSISKKELLKYIAFLAADEFVGREAGSDTGHEAGEFLAKEFERLELRPGGDADTYFQSFALGGTAARASLQESNRVEVSQKKRPKKAEDLETFKYRFDFMPLPVSASMIVEPSPITFVGYGISAKDLGYDDYKGKRVKGRVVVALDHVPMEGKPDSPFALEEHGREHGDVLAKAQVAEREGAVALVIIRDILNHPGETEVPEGMKESWPPTKDQERAEIPVVFASQAMGRYLLGGKDPAELQSKIDENGSPATTNIGGRFVGLQIAALGEVKGAGRNVVAVLEGSDEDRKHECVVIGAHYDHVGNGSFGSRGGRGQIHNGANDNASGTSALLEVAEAFVDTDIRPRRTIVFIAFDGEEKGLLGSKHYVGAPHISMENTVAMINMDMIGVADEFEVFVGEGQANATLEGIHVAAAKILNIGLRYDGMDQFRNRSDQGPFLDAGVPALFFFTGMHPEYHTAADDPPLINAKLHEAVSRLAFITTLEIANRDERP